MSENIQERMKRGQAINLSINEHLKNGTSIEERFVYYYRILEVVYFGTPRQIADTIKGKSIESIRGDLDMTDKFDASKPAKGQAINLAVNEALKENKTDDLQYIMKRYLHYMQLADRLQKADIEDLLNCYGDEL